MGKYVLLDRDGTVIVNKHYQKDPEITELLPNAREGLDKLKEAGFELILVTNQSGIGRGLLDRSDLAAVHRRMIQLLGGGDDYFANIYYCPHIDTDHCRCRKPGPGMAEAASLEFGFPLSDCYVVGDKDVDMEFGDSIGARTILVRTGYGKETEGEGKVEPRFIADDLLEAAEWIIAREEEGR